MRYEKALDEKFIGQVSTAISNHAKSGGQYGLLETAGGVLSPAPSGTVQADIYRPLRLTALLVGDYRLGGISSTMSAFESLHVRGYDVDSVVLFEHERYRNHEYLGGHFDKHEVKTFSVPQPPPRQSNTKDDELAMLEYYENTSSSPAITAVLDRMNEKHHNRVSKLSFMPAAAESIVWHPFRQHGLPQDLVAIDSAYGDFFQALTQDKDNSPANPISTISAMPSPAHSKSILTPLFDGSASWWTQGLGHGNPDLSLAAAHAAGRYGHIMFANAIHEPALDLSYNLLSLLANPRLSRVFFTDNGSTGMEVAVKMALRASCARYGWNKADHKIEVLGLEGSYHGDTIGVMNCSEPSPFNEKVDWYKPSGFWFKPPEVKMREGMWEVVLPQPEEMGGTTTSQTLTFSTQTEIFDFDARPQNAAMYEEWIRTTLHSLIHIEHRKFGALILEPIIMGAGGMIFVDPLFQRTLIKIVRSYDFVPSTPSPNPPDLDPNTKSWSGLPFIADEVFTGLYRLGRASSSSFLSSPSTLTNLSPEISPDISVHAKLLTGGLLPLAITTASESIFSTFLSDSKSDALLHGHSYTAHAVGCAVANKSLTTMSRMDTSGAWETYKADWSNTTTPPQTSPIHQQKPENEQGIWSFWPPSHLTALSHSPRVSGVWAFGTVLAITLRSQGPGGYTSNAAASLQSALLATRDIGDGGGVHSRVLGDVLYLMTSLTTKRETVFEIGRKLVEILR